MGCLVQVTTDQKVKQRTSRSSVPSEGAGDQRLSVLMYKGQADGVELEYLGEKSVRDFVVVKMFEYLKSER